MNLEQNIKRINKDINDYKVAQNARLIAVTKTVDVSTINHVLNCGVKDIAESRVQVLESKYKELKEYSDIVWHFIGHLQTNKVKKVVPIVEYIHSVDSIKLAKVIDDVASKNDKVQKVFLEVNVSGEDVKYGFSPQEVASSFEMLRKMENIDIIGLMTMAPYMASSQELDEIFGNLAELNNRFSLKELSMGMSMDYKNALRNGATMVRIGSALFE